MMPGSLVDRFGLLVASACDHTLTPVARAVLAQILAHYNSRTGQCSPSFERLAATAGVSRRSAVRAVRELREAGWIEREHAIREGNRGHLSNSFKPAFDRGDDGPTSTRGRDGAVPRGGDEPVPRGRDEMVPEVGTKRCLRVGTGSSPKHSKKNTGREHGDSRSSASFDAWWSAYPRKVKKDAARKAFDQVLRGGRATVEELIAGARRYAVETSADDPRWIRHPTTWLNGGCWADEPSPRQTRAAQAQRRGFSALAYVAGEPDDDG